MAFRKEIEVLYTDSDLPVVTVHLPEGIEDEKLEDIMENAFSLAIITLQAAGLEVISEGLSGDIVDVRAAAAWY